MKKHILAVCITTCSASVFAQGTIVFGNNMPNSVVAPIYGPNPADPSQGFTGNDAHSFPAGGQLYGGQPLTAADQVTVQLWAGPDVGSLAPVLNAQATIVSEGFFETLSTPVAVPGVAAGSTTDLQVRAWQNKGGTVTTWAAAVAAGVELGESQFFVSQPLGGGNIPPPNLVQMQAFNIHTPAPEPSTFVLAALGLAALMGFAPSQDRGQTVEKAWSVFIRNESSRLKSRCF
jgi:hypothetical protein